MERSPPWERLAAEHAIGDLRFRAWFVGIVRDSDRYGYAMQAQTARHTAPEDRW